MFFCEQVIISVIFILFPIAVYFLVVVCKNDLTKSQDNVILDIANISALYLLIRFENICGNNLYLMLLINVPLLVSFLYRRRVTAFLLSIVIVIYYYLSYNIDIYFLISEYLLYNVLFSVLKFDVKKNFYLIVFIKGIILSILVVYIFPDDSVLVAVTKTFLILIIFYLVTYYSFILIGKADDAVNFHNILSELEREKELKNSLFKMTHEVKNPISVCLGYLSMMDYKDINKVKKYNNIIKGEIDRTLSIMDDFNSYSKISVNKEPMDLIYLIEDTLSSTNSILSSSGIKIINNIKCDELIINSDFNKLKQVLVNIIKNSCEAISSNGEIVINLTSNKNDVLLEVKDNGMGMDNDTLEKAGEMFYTTKEKGTGLGVSLSKEIIRRLGGKLYYESVFSKGTSAFILLTKD